MSHRVTVLLAGLLTTLGVHQLCAQSFAVDRGVWQLGGSAGVSRQESGGTTSTVAGLTPTVGYFVRPGLELEIGLPLQYHDDAASHGWTYGLTPGVAYYFGGPNQRLYPYVSAAGGVQWNRSTASGASPIPGVTSTTRTWSLGGAIGVANMLSRNVALTSELYYTSVWFRSPSGVSGASTTVRASQYGMRFGIAAFVF